MNKRLMAAGLLAWTALLNSTFASAQVSDPIINLPVRFQVTNSNSSNVFCPVDGTAYEIRGNLVGPRSKIFGSTAQAITVYLHSIGWGEFFWHFTANPEYDHVTRMAQQGHVSLVYEQLGYGDSGRPGGYRSCYGGEADMTHQIVSSLRAGFYTIEGPGIDGPGAPATKPRFSKVALASHFASAFVTQPAAYSFGDVDALVITSFAEAPQFFSPTILTATGAVNVQCLLGAEMSDGTSGPRGYHFTPITPETFRRFFFNAEAAVIDSAVALRHRGPCGEAQSAPVTIAADILNLRKVTVPVLLVYGDKDVVFTNPAAAGRAQAAKFTGSSDVTLRILRNTGSALPLERTAPEFRAALSAWLKQRGF